MKLCTKLLVVAVEPDQEGGQVVTDFRVLETSLITGPHHHEPDRLPVQSGDIIYVESDQIILGGQP